MLFRISFTQYEPIATMEHSSMMAKSKVKTPDGPSLQMSELLQMLNFFYLICYISDGVRQLC